MFYVNRYKHDIYYMQQIIYDGHIYDSRGILSLNYIGILHELHHSKSMFGMQHIDKVYVTLIWCKLSTILRTVKLFKARVFNYNTSMLT